MNCASSFDYILSVVFPDIMARGTPEITEVLGEVINKIWG